MKACTRPFIVALFVPLLVSASTGAAEQQVRYPLLEAIQPQRLLPAPPSVGSDEYKAEIDTILAIQARRSPAQVSRFKAEEKLGFAAFAGVMPDFFKPENLPKLYRLLNAASDDSKILTGIAKDYFRRKRPYKEDNSVQPLGKPEEDMSYPSGHATKGILWALILAEFEPDRSDKLLERGREIGWDRVIGGVHHPSDILAGRVLGQAVARALLKSTEFQADLKAAKAEYENFKKNESGRSAATIHSN